MYAPSLSSRLGRLEARILPKPGAEILAECDYSSPEAFALALHAAEARGSAIIVDDLAEARA